MKNKFSFRIGDAVCFVIYAWGQIRGQIKSNILCTDCCSKIVECRLNAINIFNNQVNGIKVWHRHLSYLITLLNFINLHKLKAMGYLRVHI